MTGSIHKSVAEEITRLEETIGDAWTKGLTLLMDGIVRMCPDWVDHSSYLLEKLEKPELVQLVLLEKPELVQLVQSSSSITRRSEVLPERSRRRSRS